MNTSKKLIIHKKALYGLFAIVSVIGFGLYQKVIYSSVTQPQKMTATSAETTYYKNDPRSVQKLLADPQVQTRVNTDDVVSGGVAKDGIPSIDVPMIVTDDHLPQWLQHDGDGIGVSIGGVHRFYPYQILVEHEIVNDVIGQTPILVTYCPLCYTGIVFDPVLDGIRTTFGVSGVLLNSNMVMYNRSQPESLWRQADGEAIIGPRTGERLAILPFDLTTLALFIAQHPDATVVIGDQKNPHTYHADAYGGDLRHPNIRFPNAGERDERLSPDARVVGLTIGDHARAYPIEAVEQTAPFEEDVAGRRIRVTWDKDLGAVRAFDVTDGTHLRLPLQPSFWFSWVSTYPMTTVYQYVL